MSRVRADQLVNRAATGAPSFPNGAVVTGVITATTFSGSATGLTGTPNITVGVITAASGSFTGNVSVGGTITYEDVTNVDSIGVITARSGINVTGGNTTIKGAVETVNVGSFAGGVLTLDTATGTVFSHDLQSGAIGIVSITNFPVTANTFHTVTLLLNQNSAGTANTTPATGIGTNITLTPSGVSGFTTSALVGSATTVTLSTTAEDIDVVTFGIHYNGSGTGTPANYKTFATKNGDFRYGTIGF